MEQWLFIRVLLGKIPLTVKLLLSISTVVITIGGIIHFIEPARFPSIFDGIWWALVTVSTVGYGDFVPESLAGRLLAMLLIFAGVGVMTLLVTLIASIAFSMNEASRYGELSFLGKNHIIIIGWNERSKYTIENIRKAQSDTNIVLIDESLNEAPDGYKKELHFVKGNSTEDAVLKQANIGLASSVLVTAKHQGSEFAADARTILTTLAIKSQNPTIYVIAEILTVEQLENARRAGADECIGSTRLTGSILVSSLLYHQMSGVVDELLSERLSYEKARASYIGKSFLEVMMHAYKNEDLIIGIKRSEEILLHPPAKTTIRDDDLLIVIRH